MITRRIVATASAVLVAAATIVGLASPAGAGLVCKNTLAGVVCVNVDDAVVGTGTGASSGPSEPLYYYRTFVEGGQGTNEGEVTIDLEGCWAIGATTDPTRGGTYDEAMADYDEFVGNGGSFGPCEADLVLDPADVAAAYWERAAAPPPPTPLAVAPGKALTGLTSYLEIGGDNPYVETHDTPLGVLTFQMTPRYVVDWGDGVTFDTSSQGVPHPGGPGEITHVYDEVGTATITVTAYWSTTWTLAGAGGDLPELATPTDSSLDLPVEQRQAVIDPG